MEAAAKGKQGTQRKKGEREQNRDISELRDFAYSEYVPNLQCIDLQEPLAEPSSGPPMYPPQRQLGIEHALKVHQTFMAKNLADQPTVERKVVFLLSDFGCRECKCKRRGDCNHPKLVKKITVLKGTLSEKVSGWEPFELEKRVGRELLDLAMLGHDILKGYPSAPRALLAKHKMGMNVDKEVSKQKRFWLPKGRWPKAAPPPPENSSDAAANLGLTCATGEESDDDAV